MKKPEKKKTPEFYGIVDKLFPFECGVDAGFNQAIDEYEKFLPDKKEIEKIIWKEDKFGGCKYNRLAEAIAKRMGK